MKMDFLEFSDMWSEIKGCMTPGKLKMTDQNIVFKNSKTGKVEQIQSSDLDSVSFQNIAGSWGLRIFLKNGNLHRFVGFKDSEKEKLAKFFTSTYKIDALEKELTCKGWNWGTAQFNGSVLSFNVGHNTAFEIPLNYVSQCTGGKNEITMEFHQNDDAPVSLLEMRFFIPSNDLAGDVDPIDAFQQQVMKKASVINVSGDAIAIFREIHCLTPRGRYDIKMFNTFFQLHGKTFDYKIPMSTVLRLFLLPHRDGRQMFFVVSLDPPIKQGQTRYHFLVFLFRPEEETSLELPFTEEELKTKYDGKLEKELSGPTFEVLGRIMKAVINRKITGTGTFQGHSGTAAIGCSYKAAAGFLYPLERGFIYIHKPPIHIRFDEVASVNFARGGGNTRSFDFEIELKSGTIHTFSSIEKEEYGKLYDFTTSKKLHVKNRGKNDKTSYKEDFGDSDNEAEPDAYLERVKAEAKERDSDDDDESEDDDFTPGGEESDVAEEYDSSPEDSSEDESGGESGGEKKEKKSSKKKPKKAKTVSEKPRRKREKKVKDSNRPKRPSTAYMIWLNEKRKQILTDFPGLSVIEVAKKGGELWKKLDDKSEWEGKAAKQKEEYQKAMKEYTDSGAAAEDADKAKASSGDKKKADKKEKNKTPMKKPTSTASAEGFKSKEYISDDSSGSDSEKSDKADDKSEKRKRSESPEEKNKKKKTSSTDKKDTKSKQSKKESDKSEEEQSAESTPASSDASDSD